MGRLKRTTPQAICGVCIRRDCHVLLLVFVCSCAGMCVASHLFLFLFYFFACYSCTCTALRRRRRIDALFLTLHDDVTSHDRTANVLMASSSRKKKAAAVCVCAGGFCCFLCSFFTRSAIPATLLERCSFCSFRNVSVARYSVVLPPHASPASLPPSPRCCIHPCRVKDKER
jgi:hypothetical protein